MKVIGAGLGRTGTASLQSALEELGFGPCYHMYEVFANPGHADFWLAAWRGEPADWDGVLGSYEATVDWPACSFYAELLERNPDAKVLLSVLKNSFALYSALGSGAENVVFVVFWPCFGPLLDRRPGRQRLFQHAVPFHALG